MTERRKAWCVAGLGGALFAAAGCGNDVACGPGTLRQGGLCIAEPTDDTSGSGGSAVGSSSSSSVGSSSSSMGASAGGSGAAGGGGDDLEQQLLDQLPPCEPAGNDGTIDFATGCVAGACGYMTYAEINAALGSIGVCEASLPDDPTLFCDWFDGGITALFNDADADGEPDAVETAGGIFISEPYPGGSTEGLGIGATMRCFVEALGSPTGVSIVKVGNDYLISELQFGDFDVLVDDMFSDLEFQPNGYVDMIALFGPLDL